MRTWWHWWFYGQTEKPAERVINLDPDAWYRTPSPQEMGEGNHADVWAALRDPAVVHGMCEDYRAGLRIDRAHEEADRAAGRRIACPMLLLAADAGRPRHPRRPRGDLATLGGRKATQRANPIRPPPSRTGTGRARTGATRIPRRPDSVVERSRWASLSRPTPKGGRDQPSLVIGREASARRSSRLKPAGAPTGDDVAIRIPAGGVSELRRRSLGGVEVRSIPGLCGRARVATGTRRSWMARVDEECRN